MKRFASRAAIVTGAAQGIGRAVAERFIAEGVRVALLDVEAEVLETTIDKLDNGAALWSAAADLAVGGEASRVITAAIDELGPIDILVNNAGGGVIRPTLRHTDETIRRTIDNNLLSTLNCSIAVLPHMVQRQYGRIVNVGAESVRNGLFDHAVYNAAKGGVHGFTTGLAREFAGHGITANVVAPSIVQTEQVEAMLANADQAAYLQRMIDLIPLGRAATVDEVASMVVYLASDEAGFVTGQVVSVNGGSSML